MGAYLTQIARYLQTQSWQIAALVVVIGATTFALRNRSAHLRYLLWLLVLAKSLVPPVLTVPVAVLPEKRLAPKPVPAFPTAPPAPSLLAMDEPIREPGEPGPAAVPFSARPAAVSAKRPTRERGAELTVRQWLAVAWLAGVALFIVAVLAKALRTTLWLRRSRKALAVRARESTDSVFSGLGLKKHPKVWLVEGIGQPFVWGLVRGCIYLPANFTRLCSDEDRKGVIGHELSHVLRFDAGVNLLQVVAQALYWFHPLVWWGNRRIRAEREKCCDEMAIARLNALPKDYSRAIVETLAAERESANPVPSLAVAGPLKNIEERIKTIMKPGKKFYKRPSLIAAAVTFVLAVVTVPTALLLTGYGQTEQVETEIFRLGIPVPGISEVNDGSALKATATPEAQARGERDQAIKSFLLNSGVPWPEGSNIAYNDKTGTLIVTNTPTNMIIIRELVRLWSAPAHQVEVEARFVRILPTFRFGGTPEGRLLSLLISSWTGTMCRPKIAPAEDPRRDSDQMLGLRTILSQGDFELIWSILAEKDWCDLLFAPRLTTIDGNRAAIDHWGKKRDVGFTLDFTPSFSADGRMLSLALRTEVSVAEAGSDGGAEAATFTPAESVGCAATVHLGHEETAVLAGWMPDKTVDTPANKPNLVIFITARIITPRS